MLLAGTHQEKWFYWKQAEHQAGAILLPSGELLLAVPLSKTPPSSSSSPGRKAPTTPGAVPSVRAPPSILLRKRRRWTLRRGRAEARSRLSPHGAGAAPAAASPAGPWGEPRGRGLPPALPLPARLLPAPPAAVVGGTRLLPTGRQQHQQQGREEAPLRLHGSPAGTPGGQTAQPGRAGL